MDEVGFTAFRCGTAGCGTDDSGSTAARTLETLRDAVGASRYGVLVTTGCLLGTRYCRSRVSAPVVLVQPCDDGRRPTECATLVGPLRTDEDVDALGEWLRGGELDVALLPGHLLDLHRQAVAPRS